MKILMLDAILYSAREILKLSSKEQAERVMKYCIKSDRNGGSSFGKSLDIPSGAIDVDETLIG
jgi:hypothetical protein